MRKRVPEGWGSGNKGLIPQGRVLGSDGGQEVGVEGMKGVSRKSKGEGGQ